MKNIKKFSEGLPVIDNIDADIIQRIYQKNQVKEKGILGKEKMEKIFVY